MEINLQKGALYITGTPIGNLRDISLRALSVLKEVDVICAEDTRVTQHLLSFYGIKGPRLISLREQNEAEQAQKVLSLLKEGKSVAQVSDAGMPGICDPGNRLVAQVRQAGFPLYVIPGAVALTAALSLTGQGETPFTFMGFLSAKTKERREQLMSIAENNQTVVCYEAPHRIEVTLQEQNSVDPERILWLARELTKKFETTLTGTAKSLLSCLQEDPQQKKGEMVIIFTTRIKMESDILSDAVKELSAHLLPFYPIKKVVFLVAKMMPVPKKRLYDYLLNLRNQQQD